MIKRGMRVILVSDKEFDNEVNRKFNQWPNVQIGECGVVIENPVNGLFQVKFPRTTVICTEAMVDIAMTGIEKEAFEW